MGRTDVDRDARRSQLETELARHRTACGCELGAAFTLLALLAALVYLALGQPGWSWPGAVVRTLLWVISMSLIGKALGLAHARVRVLRLRSELRRLGDPAEPHTAAP